MQTKRCTKCGQEKPFDDFYQDKNRKDGYRFECKTCTNEANKNWWQANKERHRLAGWRYHLKRTFGITSEQYNIILVAQNGKCAICGQAETSTRKGKLKRLAVDHDRKTKKIRALLCVNCNTGIGSLQHDPNLLEKAAAYVRRHQKKS